MADGIMSLHITMLYAGLSGLLLTLLSFNVMFHWVRVTGTGQETDQAMRRAEKLVSNFIEYVPLTLFLIGILEIQEINASIIHGLGFSLLSARFLHACGSKQVPGAGFLRFIGSQLTFLVLLVASIASIYLFVFGRL